MNLKREIKFFIIAFIFIFSSALFAEIEKGNTDKSVSTDEKVEADTDKETKKEKKTDDDRADGNKAEEDKAENIEKREGLEKSEDKGRTENTDVKVDDAKVKKESGNPVKLTDNGSTKGGFSFFKGAAVSGSYLTPMTDYSVVFDYGYGVNADLVIANDYFNNALLTAFGLIMDTGGMKRSLRNTVTMLSVGYYELRGKAPYDPYVVESAQMMRAGVYEGYSISFGGFMKDVRIVPYIGFGYIMHIVNYDEDGEADASGTYEYTVGYFFDPYLSFRCEAGYSVSRSLDIIFSPNYTLFFEKSRQAHLVDVSLGVRYNFVSAVRDDGIY